jgi:hypothetical protein
VSVTDADRTYAAVVAARLAATDGVLAQREVIAAGLAAERERVLANQSAKYAKQIKQIEKDARMGAHIRELADEQRRAL